MNDEQEYFLSFYAGEFFDTDDLELAAISCELPHRLRSRLCLGFPSEKAACVFVEETKILEKERGRGIKFESSRKNPRVTEKDKTEHDEALEQFWLDFSKDNQELEEWGKNKESWENQYPGIRKFEYTQRMWRYWEYAEEIRERFLSESVPRPTENDKKKPKLSFAEIEVRVIAAAKHIIKDPHITNKALYVMFELADKTLSREPHKTTIHQAREAVKGSRKATPHIRDSKEGKKGSSRGKKEKCRIPNLKTVPDQ